MSKLREQLLKVLEESFLSQAEKNERMKKYENCSREELLQAIADYMEANADLQQYEKRATVRIIQSLYDLMKPHYKDYQTIKNDNDVGLWNTVMTHIFEDLEHFMKKKFDETLPY